MKFIHRVIDFILYQLAEIVNKGKLVSQTRFMSYGDRRARIEAGVTSALLQLTFLGGHQESSNA